MRTERVQTLVLGAGPSGLAAGHTLAKAGLKPVVLERDKSPGGLMRSVHRNGYVVDIGRKELYNRIERVDIFWSSLLGPDYRVYPHRGGILHDRHIFDFSPAFQGLRRGMPMGLFMACGLDFVWSRLKPGQPTPKNVEEYFYQKRGRRLTQMFSQGFQEKLTGKKWTEIPLPENAVTDQDASFLSTLTALVKRATSKTEVNTFKGIWRHPAKGTGQICDLMVNGMKESGGTIECGAAIQSMETASGFIRSVTAEVGGELVEYCPQNVVSSIPPDILKGLLRIGPAAPPPTPGQPSGAPKRTVVLAYLFLNEEPHFPQAWLQVTCPSTRIGRITNYTGFNGAMVPPGKTCLCCEYYCFGPDELLDMDPKEIAKRTLQDCAKQGLLDPSKCVDELVLKLPGADASQNRDNWMSPARVKLLADLAPFKNLFFVNRTELDIATLAGIEAAEAITSGDRSHFDNRVDPAHLQIRSTAKAFAFEMPVPVYS